MAGRQGHHINIIDTPGHVDFTVEVERSLRVLDGAIMVFVASRACSRRATPSIVRPPVQGPAHRFINKLDRTGASFDFCVSTIKGRPNSIAGVFLQLPIGSEGGFLGVVDLVHMRALTWRGETTIGEDYTIEEIPADMLEQATAGPPRARRADRRLRRRG